MIADDANDDTRQSWLPLLGARTRLKASTVREKLAMLARRGFEFRVSHGTGKDGREVFAAKGHAMDYLVPDMLKGAGTPAAIGNGAAPKGAGISAKGAGTPAAIGPKGAGTPAPLSSKDLNPHISSV